MEELVENILEYVKEEYSDCAIMIDGKCGSGKTYFWNNLLKPKIENLIINGKKYMTIYISLYGISTFDEIDEKIFLEITQLNDIDLKKYMKENNISNIPEYVKTSINIAASNGFFYSKKLDYSSFFLGSNILLCFDDLDRSKMNITEVFAYINKFVEHDHIKTILICDEKKFLNNNLNYEENKEKVVGKTFEYLPELNYIICGMLSKYEKNPKLMQFLKENVQTISTAFLKSSNTNLRILNHALSDFQKIFNATYLNFKDSFELFKDKSTNILRSMLIFTIAMSFENVNEFKNIQDNDEYFEMLVQSKISDVKINSLIQFHNNYYFGIDTKYAFFKSIEEFIRTRIFNIEIFKKEMQNIIYNLKNKNELTYKRLLQEEYYKFNDDEFPKIIYETLLEIEDRKN